MRSFAEIDTLPALLHLSLYGLQVRPEDVLSSWCGVRPLAADPSRESESTANLVRDHVIFTDPDGLITISGGKWTTYRKMAEDAIDAAEASGQLEGSVGLGGGPAECNTSDLRLIGAETWKRNLNVEVRGRLVAGCLDKLGVPGKLLCCVQERETLGGGWK